MMMPSLNLKAPLADSRELIGLFMGKINFGTSVLFSAFMATRTFWIAVGENIVLV